jgi:hypothetical protein
MDWMGRCFPIPRDRELVRRHVPWRATPHGVEPQMLETSSARFAVAFPASPINHGSSFMRAPCDYVIRVGAPR